MKIELKHLEPLLNLIKQKKMVSVGELALARTIASDDFVFLEQLKIADSIHFHIHVPEVEELPHEEFENHGGEITNRNDGYVKYGFPGSINLIFSHIPVAQREELIPKSDSYLDHIGIDIRSDQKPEYIIFQQLPLICSQNDFYFTRQGDGVEAVKCCHMQVKEKYWVYTGLNVNFEFAFGPLIIHEKGFGVDLRPANPFNKPVKQEGSSCCGAPAENKTEKKKLFV